MQVIDNILYYIQQHFDRELSLEVLAREAHYSPYHFHRLFKQQVGEAPKQYLLRLRLEKATKELLFYPEKSVYAIAMDCGFSSQPVFSRAFKARYRLSAEQYREQALQAIRERTDAITPDVQQYPGYHHPYGAGEYCLRDNLPFRRIRYPSHIQKTASMGSSQGITGSPSGILRRFSGHATYYRLEPVPLPGRDPYSATVQWQSILFLRRGYYRPDTDNGWF